ncbi:hypothetical protein [Streptomyces sp. NPDC002676]
MIRKREAVAVAAAALLSGLAVAPAQAVTSNSVTPAACSVINIGLPGNITINNEYVGQVEQQYDNCHNVRVHWQWSSGYRAKHPSAQVLAGPFGWNGTVGWGLWQYANQSQDYYSPWTYIYTNGENTWRARAEVAADNGVYCAPGLGDWHRYSDGAEFGSAQPAIC